MQMVLGTVCFEIQLRLYSHSLSKQLDDRHCSVYFDNEIFATVHPREKREAGSNCNNAWHLSDLDPTKEWFRTRPPPPTYGETWSTEAPVNLSCVEHALITKDARRAIQLTVTGNSGQSNRSCAFDVRLSTSDLPISPDGPDER